MKTNLMRAGGHWLEYVRLNKDGRKARSRLSNKPGLRCYYCGMWTTHDNFMQILEQRQFEIFQCNHAQADLFGQLMYNGNIENTPRMRKVKGLKETKI